MHCRRTLPWITVVSGHKRVQSDMQNRRDVRVSTQERDILLPRYLNSVTDIHCLEHLPCRCSILESKPPNSSIVTTYGTLFRDRTKKSGS